MTKRLTFEEFEERVQKAYDGCISVVKETYTGTRNKVTAYCNIHKIYFEVRAYELSRKETDCPECHKEHLKRPKNSWQSMLKRFRDKWGEKYSYDEKTYTGFKTEMTVHCNDCGEDFKITPEHHLKYNNGGCPNCHKTRIVKCSCCGKEIEVDRHIGDNQIVYCNKCRKTKKFISRMKANAKREHNIILSDTEVESNYKYCKICGRLLNDDLMCENEFCNEHNYNCFDTLVKYFGFDKSKIGTEEVETEFNRVRSILYNMYWNESMSTTEIAKHFNYKYPGNLSNKVFKYLHIPSKSLSQATSENLKMGRFELPDV